MSEPGHVIAAIEVWACRLPLPHPLSFRAFVVREREYVALRVTTRSGLVADTVALSRRSPIDVAISDVLAEVLVGRDATDIRARMDDLARATRALDEHGVFGRARSLVETCLWDLRAQARQLPLWRALGGTPRELPVLLVEGYPLPGEPAQAFADRLAARAQEGFRAMKIEAASYGSAEELADRLRRLRRVVGDEVELVVDLAWSYDDLDDALRAADMWQPYDLRWIEDPFARSRARDTAELRRRGGVPIAAGDEATRPGELEELLDAGAVDVLRLDATAIGGVDATRALALAARRHGASASAHVHPELHVHCALADPAFAHVEAFPTDRPFDCSHELLVRPFMAGVRDGHAPVPDEAGTGMRLDLDAVRRTSYRHAITYQEER